MESWSGLPGPTYCGLNGVWGGGWVGGMWLRYDRFTAVDVKSDSLATGADDMCRIPCVNVWDREKKN